MNANTINLNPMDSQNSNYKNTKSNLAIDKGIASPFRSKNIQNASSLLAGTGSHEEIANSQENGENKEL
jgi:hypothetical protein